MIKLIRYVIFDMSKHKKIVSAPSMIIVSVTTMFASTKTEKKAKFIFCW